MSSKYADLPDIDTAPDVYETEDTFPSSHAERGDSSDDEGLMPTRSVRSRNAEHSGKEELDLNSLLRPEEARKKFRRSEKRQERIRALYAYPPSPETPTSPLDPTSSGRPVPLSQRLRTLQTELSALEAELADPTNPLLHKEREEDNVDPGELIRGLVDVRGRLDKIRKGKEGKGRLVGVVLGDDNSDVIGDQEEEEEREKGKATGKEDKEGGKVEVKSIVDMDKRVGQLEKLVGSSNVMLDESSSLPPPLLPTALKLQNQITILTQPRHIDSISRRLKLLLSDLDRAGASQHAHRRQQSQTNGTTSSPSGIHEQLLPLLTRLTPALPQIPHILTRLRTLATLHTSAAEFQGTLEGMEEEQQKIRDALKELESAVQTVEENWRENRQLVKNNVAGLDNRVDELTARLDELTRERELFQSSS